MKGKLASALIVFVLFAVSYTLSLQRDNAWINTAQHSEKISLCKKVSRGFLRRHCLETLILKLEKSCQELRTQTAKVSCLQSLTQHREQLKQTPTQIFPMILEVAFLVIVSTFISGHLYWDGLEAHIKRPGVGKLIYHYRELAENSSNIFMRILTGMALMALGVLFFNKVLYS